MNRIGTRLVAGYLLLVAMMVALALYAAVVSRRFLMESIGTNSVFMAEDMLSSMDRALESRIEEAKRSAVSSLFRQQAEESNKAFDHMSGREAFMQLRAAEWSGADPATPPASLAAVLGNAASQELRSAFLGFFMDEQGSLVFTRALLTNAYGAVIASTEGTNRFRQDDQQWWQEARDKGRSASEVSSDPRTGQPIILVGVCVLGAEGEFIGALEVAVGYESVVRPTIISTRKFETTQLKLTTTSGRMLYSTKTFQLMEDVSRQPYYAQAVAQSGYLTVREGGKDILMAYTRSEVVGEFLPKDWLLFLGHDVDEVLAPASALMTSILLASGVLVIAGMLIAFLMARSITRPIQKLTAATSEMSKGSLDKTIDVRWKNEIGSLARSFNAMNDSLRGMVAVAEKISEGDLTMDVVRRSETDLLGISLERMLQNLRAQVREILEAAGRLAGSSAQIFSATTQLASAAAESASAVGQTTATVEEVKQTAHLANEKALAVSEASARTVQVAEGGRRAVDGTREVMSRIKEQMEAIARNILGLSEQSQAIGEIVTSVTDLADQSRLLAVNAAIEAARAGEYGRGFGVVAQEIKDLAEQSKKATSQVRGLLNDVQKAVNASVLAMEQGSKAMDAGQEQAEQAGGAIRELARSIGEAANAATQIAASSHQQLVGMDQVASAMENVKEAAGENVQSTKQLETEVQTLYELSQKLKQTAELYKV